MPLDLNLFDVFFSSQTKYSQQARLLQQKMNKGFLQLWEVSGEFHM